MSAWALKIVLASANEWFLKRFARARALIPAADFDTIVGEEFQNTIDSELVDVTGTVAADPVSFYNAGVVSVTAGDAVVSPCKGRLALTGAPSHVGDLAGKSWYIAALVKINRPADDEMGDAQIDAVSLWGDDDNRVGVGIDGASSGGSVTNWVGYADKAASRTTTLGPALDGEESPVWHLFEGWFDVNAGELRFAIDGTAFADPIDVADIPAFPAMLSAISARLAVGDPSTSNYDKWCCVVASPRVGETT